MYSRLVYKIKKTLFIFVFTYIFTLAFYVLKINFQTNSFNNNYFLFDLISFLITYVKYTGKYVTDIFNNS